MVKFFHDCQDLTLYGTNGKTLTGLELSKGAATNFALFLSHSRIL